MSMEFTCQRCGTTLRADHEDELVQAAQRHNEEQHGMSSTREEILERARPSSE